MTDAVWRLMWVLPLVLTTGVVVMLVLKRIVVPSRAGTPTPQRMRVGESLQLSEQTRVHLLDVDGRSYVVIESAQQVVLQIAAPESQAAPAPRLPWIRR